MFEIDLDRLPADRHVLIAGPTACGKSDLALRIAQAQGGTVVNADASQVFGGWHVITARPSAADEARAPHALYGHVAWDAPYSTGHWLREVSELLQTGERLIFVGGTGLYFAALTDGLSEIPATPQALRQEADGHTLAALLDDLDAPTKAQIDTANRARVQRAWEVLRATGRGLADWQAQTPAPLLPIQQATALVLDAPKDWLTPRIACRFDRMLKAGALDEVRAMQPVYTPSRPAFRAIGVRELTAHLNGEMSLDAARAAAIIATRQYAKRQRTWARKRMAGWVWLSQTT